MKLCAAYKVFNAETYLEYSMRSVYEHVDRIVVLLSRQPWSNAEEVPDGTEALLRRFPDPRRKLKVIRVDWGDVFDGRGQLVNEITAVNFLLHYIRKHLPDMTHYFYVDADEVYDPCQLVMLREALKRGVSDREVRGIWRCYWKSFRYWVDPPEPSRPLVAFPITPDVCFTSQRETNLPSPPLVVDELFLHHLSYAVNDEEVTRRKCGGTHGEEFRARWFEEVWKAWDACRTLTNLHPVNPEHFQRVVPSRPDVLPEVLRTHPYHGQEVIR